MRAAARVCAPRSKASARAKRSSVVAVSAGTAAHDLALLDGDLDGAVARPVLGVDRVVLDGGVEPQPVALLAVVERALQRPGAAAAPAATAGAATGRALLLSLVLVPVLLLGGALGRLLGELRLFLGAAGLLGLELR